MKKITYNNIYKELKLSPLIGGNYLSRFLDYIDKNNIKSFDINTVEISKIIAFENEEPIVPKSIRTTSERYLNNHFIKDKKIADYFKNKTKKITLKTFLVIVTMMKK